MNNALCIWTSLIYRDSNLILHFEGWKWRMVGKVSFFILKIWSTAGLWSGCSFWRFEVGWTLEIVVPFLIGNKFELAPTKATLIPLQCCFPTFSFCKMGCFNCYYKMFFLLYFSMTYRLQHFLLSLTVATPVPKTSFLYP